MSHCWWHSCSATLRQSDGKLYFWSFQLFPQCETSFHSIEQGNPFLCAGGGDESPHCHLLEVDGFNFLLDCGWDETFDMVFINNLKKVSNSHPQRWLSIWNCKVSILQFHKKILIFSREPKASQWTTWPGPSCLDHTKTLAHFVFPSYPLESRNLGMMQTYDSQLQVVGKIDAVLLSYPDCPHLGALPYAVGKLVSAIVN